jgi:hypothetical protein
MKTLIKYHPEEVPDTPSFWIFVTEQILVFFKQGPDFAPSLHTIKLHYLMYKKYIYKIISNTLQGCEGVDWIHLAKHRVQQGT